VSIVPKTAIESAPASTPRYLLVEDFIVNSP
jgi:hypothetical protein